MQGFQTLGDLPVLTDSHRELDNLTKFVTAQKNKMKKMSDEEKNNLMDYSGKNISKCDNLRSFEIFKHHNFFFFTLFT